MSDKLFYADISKERCYSYDDLLRTLNHASSFFPVHKTDNIFDFFSNLITGIISDADITILDNDFSDEELTSFGIPEEDLKKIIHTEVMVKDLSDLLDKIKNSSSIIRLFTSGTTGKPKQIKHNIKTLTRGVKINEKAVSNIWGTGYNPMHIAGLQVFFQALFNFNSIINLFQLENIKIFESIEKFQITHISATPTFFRVILPVETNFKSVQNITLGGESSDQFLYDKISESFPNARIRNIYASTEAGTLFTSFNNIFSVPSEFLRLISFTEENELLIHKSLLGETDFKFDQKWYNTGDVVKIISQEPLRFMFVSRSNDFINTGGNKVNPEEVRSLVLRYDGVKNAVVYGRRSSILGNIVCCDIEMEAGTEFKEIEMRAYLKKHLQDYKIPRIFKVVLKIELTRTAKIKSR